MSDVLQAAILPGSMLAFSAVLRALTPFLAMCSQETRAWLDRHDAKAIEPKTHKRKRNRKS